MCAHLNSTKLIYFNFSLSKEAQFASLSLPLHRLCSVYSSLAYEYISRVRHVHLCICMEGFCKWIKLFRHSTQFNKIMSEKKKWYFSLINKIQQIQCCFAQFSATFRTQRCAHVSDALLNRSIQYALACIIFGTVGYI